MSNEKNIYWQSVRGICILAVVLIHSLQCYDFNNGIVIIRQIINFAVAIFVFMAGYFVNIDKVSSKRFSAKRWIINRGGGETMRALHFLVAHIQHALLLYKCL